MIPTPQELTYFLETVQAGTISRAAERLGISQPSLSVSMQRLEEKLGVALLLRQKNGVVVTKAGKRFMTQARSLIEAWERIRLGTLADECEVAGGFSIGCHPAVARYTLPQILPRVLRDYPRLDLHVVHDLSRCIVEGVISFRIDFGIVVNPVAHPELVIRHVLEDQVCLWAAESPSALQDCSRDDWVLICDPSLAQTQHILRELRRERIGLGRILTCSSLDVAAALVAEGAGVGVLPARVAQQHGKGALRRLEGPIYADSLALVYRADAQSSVASRALAGALRSGLESLCRDQSSTPSRMLKKSASCRNPSKSRSS